MFKNKKTIILIIWLIYLAIILLNKTLRETFWEVRYFLIFTTLMDYFVFYNLEVFNEINEQSEK